MRMLRILLAVSLCANAVPPQDDTNFDVQLLQTTLSVETKPDIAATQIEHTTMTKTHQAYSMNKTAQAPMVCPFQAASGNRICHRGCEGHGCPNSGPCTGASRCSDVHNLNDYIACPSGQEPYTQQSGHCRIMCRRPVSRVCHRGCEGHGCPNNGPCTGERRCSDVQNLCDYITCPDGQEAYTQQTGHCRIMCRVPTPAPTPEPTPVPTPSPPPVGDIISRFRNEREAAGWEENYGWWVSTSDAVERRADAEMQAEAAVDVAYPNQQVITAWKEARIQHGWQENYGSGVSTNDAATRRRDAEAEATEELEASASLLMTARSTAGRCGLKIYTNLSDDANYNHAYEKIRSACLELPYSEVLCDEVLGELFKSKKGQMTSVFNVAQFDAFCNATRDLIKADFDHWADMDTLESSHSDGASSLLANRASNSAPLHARGRTVDKVAGFKSCK